MGFKQVTQKTERNSFAGFLVFVQDRARMQPLLFHLIMMISKFNILGWVLVVFKIGQDSAVLIRKNNRENGIGQEEREKTQSGVVKEGDQGKAEPGLFSLTTNVVFAHLGIEGATGYAKPFGSKL